MILADKITELRKKSGLSQEELAENLGVSRQAVSKWESAQSTPDLNRILQMSELFSVSTDILLKDELDLCELPAAETLPFQGETEPPVRRVTLGEANEFLTKTDTHSTRIAAAVALFILSPIPPILLDAGGSIVELGAIFMLLFIAAGVGVLIYSGIVMAPFDFLSHQYIETEYGVDGMVKEKKARHQSKYAISMCIGVSLCILSPVMPIVFDGHAGESVLADASGAFLFLFVAAGVFSILKATIVKGAYQKLLEEDGFSRASKAKDRNIKGAMAVYWLIATALYLGWSFITMSWERTWIVWPIAGVLCPVVAIVANAVKNRHKK